MRSKTLFTILLSVSILLFADVSFAQSTTLKLPTTDISSDFSITQSDDTPILRVFGTGGFYFGGTFAFEEYDPDDIPASGAGMRFMWNPSQGAFRVGEVTDYRWDYEYTGYYSIAMGYNTYARGDYSVALGYNTYTGDYATATGFNTTASGWYSTAMGSYAHTNNRKGSFVIGDASSEGELLRSSINNSMFMRFDGGYYLFSSSDLTTGVSMRRGENSWSSVSDSTKKENFIPADHEYFLSSLSKLRLGSWNYKSQDPKEFRHYGPMAQEIFHYFGNDGIGIIGNDTTLASADMDGIMMIFLQALEKKVRSRESEISELKKEIAGLKKMKEEFTALKAELSSLLKTKDDLPAGQAGTQARFADHKQQ